MLLFKWNRIDVLWETLTKLAKYAPIVYYEKVH